MTTATSLWKRFAWIVAIAFVIAVSSTARLNAQGYAKIVGTVSDQSGAVVSSATVTATQTSTGNTLTTTTGKDGSFVFPSLLPSNYSVTVTATGFETYIQANILLQADQSVTVLVKLKVGSTAQSITVTSAPPQIDTTSGQLSQVVGEQAVIDMPLNGRQAAGLVYLVAGVVVAPSNGLDQGNGKTFQGQAYFTSNGAQNTQSTYLLNGANNLDEMTNIGAPYPMPDDIQEFSVLTSSFNAQYGQAAGAVVNIVTKSGGQKFHGDAFDFERNNYFDAHAWNATLDTLHRHQYGGTIGGPVIIPHISKGKSTQFFFGYQYTQQHSASNSAKATLPTAAEEGKDPADAGYGTYGDFSAACPGGFTGATVDGVQTCGVATEQIYDAFNLAPVSTPECSITAAVLECPVPLANNHIPIGRFDPAAKAFEALLPAPTLTVAGASSMGVTAVNNYPYYTPSINNFREFFGRVDHQFGEKDQLFGHFFHDWTYQPGYYNPTNLLGYAGWTSVAYTSAALAETHTFSGNILNNLVVSYQHEIALRNGMPGSPCITSLGVTNIDSYSQVGCVLNGVSITNFTGVSAKAYADWLRNNYTLNDDFHWIKGKHDIGFGGHIEISKFDLTSLGNLPATFSFTSVASNSPNFYGPTSAGTGALATTIPAGAGPFAAFELGAMSNFTQGGAEDLANRNHFPGLYIQDNWKVNPKLTLNYGLRWEAFVPWENQLNKGQISEFLPSNYTSGIASTMYPNLPIGMAVSGDAGVVRYGLKNQLAKMMPRVGFAYDVFGDGKTVIRSGAGLFYQTRLQAWMDLNQAAQAPYQETVSPSYPAGSNPGGPFSNPYGTGLTANTGTAANGGATGGPINNPFPFLSLPSGTVWPKQIVLYEFDPTGKFKVPTITDFNLIIEHQLLPQTAVRLAYVGSISRHNLVSQQINPAVNFNDATVGTVAYAAAGLNDTLRQPINVSPYITPCVAGGVTTASGGTAITPAASCASGQAPFAQIVEWQPTAAGNYNSLQVTIDQKLSHGLTFKLNYTWSKALDDLPYLVRLSNIEDLNAGESYVYPTYPAGMTLPAGAAPLNFANPKALDIGPSDFNHKNVLSISYVYALPKLQQGNSALKYLANGWRLGGLVKHTSGDMLTPYDSGDTSSTNLSQDRGQLVPGQNVNGKRSAISNCGTLNPCKPWINPAAIIPPVMGTTASPGVGFSTLGFGNVQKSSITGPANTNWDADAFRDLPLPSLHGFNSHLEFRAEYFNVLNHVQLNDPQLSVTSGTFGAITGASNNRIGEFSMKYVF